MKSISFKNQAAQGDLFIKRIDALPSNVKEVKPTKGVYIVAHSETGHHHVIEAMPGCQMFINEQDPMTSYLNVINATEVVLKHLRSFDTHAPIAFTPGLYQFRRARERTPEGWRKVTD